MSRSTISLLVPSRSGEAFSRKFAKSDRGSQRHHAVTVIFWNWRLKTFSDRFESNYFLIELFVQKKNFQVNLQPDKGQTESK